MEGSDDSVKAAMVRVRKTKNNQNKPLPHPEEETGGEIVRTERSNSTKNKIRVTVDSDGLDCTICIKPLCPPVHECYSGHLVCISCWKKVEYICPTCRQPRGKRNIAFEAVLESAHLPCTYSHLGCRESVSYSKSLVHASTCEFGPSLCPIPGCGQKAFSGEWRSHFLKEHWNPGPHNSEVGSCYNYGEYCTIKFDEKDLYYTLIGPGKDLFLLVKEPILNVGYVPLLYYIDVPGRGQNVFPCELRVVTRENCTNLVTRQSKAVSIKEWNRGEVRDFSLFLPIGYYSRNTEIHILIKEEGEEKKEEEDKEEEDKEPPAKRNKRSAAEASIKTKGKLEKKEKDGGQEVKVQEEKEGKKKGKKREAAAKPQKEEKKEAKASTSNAAKEKKKPAAKKQGNENVSAEVKSPTKEELHAVISELLMKVDFNTVTIGDILPQLGAQFKIDLMDRKGEVKQIIVDVINNMSEEEEDEDVINSISGLSNDGAESETDGAESDYDMEISDVDSDDSDVASDDFYDNFIKKLGYSLPDVVCTCTGTARKCSNWDKSGWQSLCCTSNMSKYPLLMNKSPIVGRRMRKKVFHKILQKLDWEGYNFAEPIDLKEFWGKRGSNHYVTKR